MLWHTVFLRIMSVEPCMKLRMRLLLHWLCSQRERSVKKTNANEVSYESSYVALLIRKTRIKLPLMFIVLCINNFACEHKSTDVSIHSTIKESWVHSDTNVCLPLDESKSRSFVATSKYFCPCDLSIMIRTVKSRFLTPVTNSKVKFFPKGKVHKHQKSPL